MTILHAGTYLSPSIPVEYFEMILQYLETKLNIHTTLLYDSKSDDCEIKKDLFASEYLDLAWMPCTSYLKLLETPNLVELLPVSSIHKNNNSEDRPASYTDIVMHIDLSEKVKEFIDLRGYKFAYDKQLSFSSHVITLKNLKELGENASFFGSTRFTGSHLESIKAILNKKVDAAAVDSNTLYFFREKNPLSSEELVTLTSWGPLPPYPFVVRSSLSDTLKTNIVQCLLNMHTDALGMSKLKEFNVLKFASIDEKSFQEEVAALNQYKNLSTRTAYY